MRLDRRRLVYRPNALSSKPPLLGLFAQSPQLIDMGDTVRIYFSTRSRDANGMFRSHVAFVDMSRDFRRVIRESTEVTSLGSLGTFDEHGIFPFSPILLGDRLLAYTTGWSRRVAVPVETAIGLQESLDGGETFQRTGDGPIVASSLHEPFLVGDGFVRAVGDRAVMWYIFGTQWIPGDDGPPERVYKIGQATSPDGENWSGFSGVPVIQDRLGPDECQALPTVVERAGRFHMVFCYRQATGFRSDLDRGYRLGYAYSDDLQEWVRADDALELAGPDTAFDRQMMCYPHLCEVDGGHFLLYNGNAFGREGFAVAEVEW